MILGVFLQNSLPEKFVRIPAATYMVGSKSVSNNLSRKVTIKSFEIATTEVTNHDFSAFVKATGYVTLAEKLHNGMIFEPGLKEFKWLKDPTASWKFPNGKTRGGIADKGNHPVTGISETDALAYCVWAKVRLPSLDEWEIACRAGTNTDYFFGSDLTDLKLYANVWYGKDHLKADKSDGFLTTSPVASFKANPWGLYDIYGNVFEFCSGRLKEDKSAKLAHARGGSWWCSKNACCAFNSFYIGKVNPRASFSNLGFRVARDVKQ